jgi:hypothetical protein
MPIEFIGMIGVRPEGADGAAGHVSGGEIGPAWVRDSARVHDRPGFDPLHDAEVRREAERRDRAAA